MTGPAQIQRIEHDAIPSVGHATRIVITPTGDLTIRVIGCAGKRGAEQKSAADALGQVRGTITLNVGDIVYPTGLNIKGVDLQALIRNDSSAEYQAAYAKLQKRTREWIETIRKYLAEIYRQPTDTSLHILANGNHEGGCEGLSPEKVLEVVLAKLNAMPQAVQEYNKQLEHLTITLADGSTKVPKFEFKHRFQFHEIVRDGAAPGTDPEAVIITLDSTVLPADEDQIRWLKEQVIPYLIKHPTAKIILSMHHSPGFTTGRRAVDTKDAAHKYPKISPELIAKFSELQAIQDVLNAQMGNQHYQAQLILNALGLPFDRTVGVYAHEHTVSAWTHSDYDAQQDFGDATRTRTHVMPAVNFTSGGSGATSNRKDWSLLVPEMRYANGKDYGFVALTFDQGNADHFTAQHIGATAPKSPLWQEDFSFTALAQKQHAPTTAAVVPEEFKKNQAAWYLRIVALLKINNLDHTLKLQFIRHLIGALGDYKRDTLDAKAKVPGLLRPEAFKKFLEGNCDAGQTDADKIAILLKDLRGLIAFYIHPARKKHGSLFLKQLSLVYFLLRNAYIVLTQNTSLTLANINYDTYFASSHSSTEKTPNTLQRLLQKLKPKKSADEDSDDEDEVDQKGLADKPDRAIKAKHRLASVSKFVIVDIGEITFSSFNSAAFKKTILDLLLSYLVTAKKETASYYRNPPSSPETARLLLLYQHLENPNLTEENGLLEIFRAAYENVSAPFKALLMDRLGEHSVDIFGDRIEELEAYQQIASKIASLTQGATEQQRHVEITRVFMDYWLRHHSNQQSPLIELFSETSLAKLGLFQTVVPRAFNDPLRVFNWYDSLNYLLEKKLKPGSLTTALAHSDERVSSIFSRRAKKTLTCYETYRTILREFTQQLADATDKADFFTRFQNQVSDSKTCFDFSSSPPVAIHSFDDSTEVRTFKAMLENVCRSLPDNQMQFSNLIRQLQSGDTALKLPASAYFLFYLDRPTPAASTDQTDNPLEEPLLAGANGASIIAGSPLSSSSSSSTASDSPPRPTIHRAPSFSLTAGRTPGEVASAASPQYERPQQAAY